jgi:hypothetical protein
MTDYTLTAKQAEVFKLLAGGMKPSDVAKKMKISSSGVYGHIRKMRAHGVAIPGEAIPNAEQQAAEAHEIEELARANGNGHHHHATPEESIQAAVAESRKMIEEVDAVMAAHRGTIHSAEEAIKQGEVEKVRLVGWIEKLDKAGQALA